MITPTQRMEMTLGEMKTYVEYMEKQYPNFSIDFDLVPIERFEQDKTLIITDIIVAESELYRQEDPQEVVKTSVKAYEEATGRIVS